MKLMRLTTREGMQFASFKCTQYSKLLGRDLAPGRTENSCRIVNELAVKLSLAQDGCEMGRICRFRHEIVLSSLCILYNAISCHAALARIAGK